MPGTQGLTGCSKRVSWSLLTQAQPPPPVVGGIHFPVPVGLGSLCPAAGVQGHVAPGDCLPALATGLCPQHGSVLSRGQQKNPFHASSFFFYKTPVPLTAYLIRDRVRPTEHSLSLGELKVHWFGGLNHICTFLRLPCPVTHLRE